MRDSSCIHVEGEKIAKYGLELRDYDMRNEGWSLDSLYRVYCRLSNYSDVPMLLSRQDENGKVFDRYPEKKISGEFIRLPEHSQLLGYRDVHYLVAWFNYPFYYFWKHQKYGLLLFLCSFVVTFYYWILIIRKERLERQYNSLLGKQTVFIHDLKGPLCTNRDIESRVLKNIANWPPEKIHQKLKISSLQSEQIVAEMEKLALRSAACWGGKIENCRFNLKKVLEELITCRQATKDYVHIQLDFRLGQPEVVADPFHIIHIVGNLIDNAVKHADGPVEITVICSADKRRRLMISVKDNGPGIPCHLQKRIFRTGYHSGVHENSHGIGLAYIRKIIRQYSGTIRVKSQENVGTEFILTFCPAKAVQGGHFVISPCVYRYFFFSLLAVGVVDLICLYVAERIAFLNREEKVIEAAEGKISVNSVMWRMDTTYFRNNWDEKTVTIVRNFRDTTIPMGTRVHQGYLYSRSNYDLRGEAWNLDSLAAYYRRNSTNPLPVAFARIDAEGKTFDRSVVEVGTGFLPLAFNMPLGYVEGHLLEARLVYPWMQPLIYHRGWLIIFILSTLLAGWFCHLLTGLTRREQAIIRFQRENVQHFIRTLQPELCQLAYAEKEIMCQLNHFAGEQICSRLNENIRRYKIVLDKINVLLEQIIKMRTT